MQDLELHFSLAHVRIHSCLEQVGNPWDVTSFLGDHPPFVASPACLGVLWVALLDRGQVETPLDNQLTCSVMWITGLLRGELNGNGYTSRAPPAVSPSLDRW